MRFELRRARRPGVTQLDDGTVLVGPHPVDSDLVGVWNVKPVTTLEWLSARHPKSTYFIRAR